MGSVRLVRCQSFNLPWHRIFGLLPSVTSCNTLDHVDSSRWRSISPYFTIQQGCLCLWLHVCPELPPHSQSPATPPRSPCDFSHLASSPCSSWPSQPHSPCMESISVIHFLIQSIFLYLFCSTFSCLYATYLFMICFLLCPLVPHAHMFPP